VRARLPPRLLVALEVATIGVLGALLGLFVAGTVSAPVGPFQADLTLRPSVTGGSVVAVPPLGELEVRSHPGPVQFGVRITQLRDEAARSIVANPERLQDLGDEVAADVRSGLLRLALQTVLVTVLGAASLGFLVFRSWRRTLFAGATGLVLLLVTGAWTAATFDRQAITEPRFHGLLAIAPTAVGDVRDLVERFDAYSVQLGRLVSNVSELYAVTSRLPTFTPEDDTVRLLHVSDLHLNPAAWDIIRSVVEQFQVDVVLDTGDLTDWGSAPESRYVAEIATLGVPYVYVRGNHDSLATQEAVARLPNAVVLDGPEVVEVARLRFLGLGDPRFASDRSAFAGETKEEALISGGRLLGRSARTALEPPDVVAMHDQAMAHDLFGSARLVLAGHAHRRERHEDDGTLLLVQGSTGGAGLRALEPEEPTPYSLSVLYMDPVERSLLAYDEITLGGLGTTDARITRRVPTAVAEAATTGAEASPDGAGPDGAGGRGSTPAPAGPPPG
jgi:predicted phosphodiesterase